MASQAPPVNQIVSKLKNKETQLMKTDLNIEFNKTCKKLSLIPNYISINIKNKSEAAQKTLKQAKLLWLKNEIKSLYKKKSKLHNTINFLKSKLHNTMTPEDYKKMLTYINEKVNAEKHVKQTTQQQKVDALKIRQMKSYHQNVITTHQFYPKIINLTNISWEENETKILEQNPKCHPNAKTKQNQNIIQNLFNTEVALEQVKPADRDRIRYGVVETIEKELKHSSKKKYHINNTDIKTIQGIKEKLVQNNAQIVPADKSNSSVIIDDLELNSKVEQYLQKNNVFEIKDKTRDYNLEIKNFLDNNTIIHPEKIKILYNSNPSPPMFRPLVKTHKEGTPIRPVINAIPSPSYKVAKYINSMIKNNIPNNANNSCKNTKDFIQRIQNINILERHTLSTIDVENMYGNIPRKEAIIVLKDKLTISKNFTEEEINDIIKIVTIITEQSYFSYNNKIYYDPNGLPMGGPLSATLAEIYMQDFEEKYILSDANPYHKKIIFYARYVDDAFLALNCNQRQANLLLNYLNKIHNQIKFKMEIESENRINFLDITITKNKTHTVQIGIYRKPTQTDLVIPALSNHPYNQKMAAFRSLTYRLLNYNLSTEEYYKEKSTIEKIAKNNGYNPKIIEPMINKMSKKIKLHKSEELTQITQKQQNSRYISFKYVDKTSQKIGKIFQRAGYTPAYRVKTKPIPMYKINNENDPSLKDQKGVYKITCESPCNKQYIGYTNRTFWQRFKEHNSAHHTNPTSIVGKHLKENQDHTIKFPDSLNVLSLTKSKSIAKVHESYEIYKHINNIGPDLLLNKKEDYNNSIIFKTINVIEDTTRRFGKPAFVRQHLSGRESGHHTIDEEFPTPHTPQRTTLTDFTERRPTATVNSMEPPRPVLVRDPPPCRGPVRHGYRTRYASARPTPACDSDNQ